MNQKERAETWTS